MRHPDDGMIEEYLDGELPAEARGDFDAHAAGCDACRERIEAARSARSEADELVALLGEPATRPGTGELPASLRPAARRPVRWRTLAWAASVLAAAGLGYAGGTADRWAVGRLDGRAVGPSNPPAAAEATGPQPSHQSPAEPAAGASAEPRANGTTDRAASRRTDVAAEPPGRHAVGETLVRPSTPSPSPKLRVDGALAAAAGADEAGRVQKAAAPAGEQQSLEFRRRAEAASFLDGIPARPGDRGAGYVSPSAVGRPAPVPTLDDAVRALGGSIRLVDGLEVQRVEVAWLPMPGGDSSAVVELTYADAAGHPIVLRQSRTVTAVGQAAGADAAQANAVAPARERALAAEPPTRRAAEAARDGEISWLDATGFRLVLRADADADSLARIRARVR